MYGHYRGQLIADALGVDLQYVYAALMVVIEVIGFKF